MVDIRVRDNGPGIDRDNIDRIFTPFFTTRGDSGGHGLGLTICHEIASAAGGGIGLDTSPDTGTIFTLRLRR